MENSYQGVKFQFVSLPQTTHQSPLHNLIVKWAAIFAECGFTPPLPGGFAGNLSLKDTNGFYITAAGANLARIDAEAIVKVISVDILNKKVFAEGSMPPSSETFLHFALYASCPAIKAIFHGHYSPFAENAAHLNLPVTAREAPYGSPELVSQALSICPGEKVFLLKNHGFLSLAADADTAGNQILCLYNQLLSF